MASEREKIVEQYIKKLKDHMDMEEKVKTMRLANIELNKKMDKIDDQMKALQSVGEFCGEVLKVIDDDRVIIKESNSARYIVNVRPKVDRKKLLPGTRVALNSTTHTIMRILPREVNSTVFSMLVDDNKDKTSFLDIGGLTDQVREIRETIELPLVNPELFKRLGIKPPKGVLLYGPPGTGKTLLARAMSCNIEAKFMKVVASAIVEKYIGEAGAMIRSMFAYAKDHQPCIIFIDEIDAIGGRRLSDGTSSDRETGRTLMDLLNQMDGFDELGKVKIVMATNRPDVLDPALMRPGRLDRKIEIPLPNEQARVDILKIHAKNLCKKGDIDYESLAKICDGFNGADMRNVCTEAGMYAIRAEREFTINEDFVKAARKIKDTKKLESKMDYGTIA